MWFSSPGRCITGRLQHHKTRPASFVPWASKNRLAQRWLFPRNAVAFIAAIVLIVLSLSSLLDAQTLQHRYSFQADATDSIGGANGTLIGNAYVSNHSLYLPGGGTSASPSGYVSLPNGIVSNDVSITVECWVTDNAGSVWAEAWCFGDSAAGPGQPPTSGTAYISLIPHSGGNDIRAAFNLTGGDEIDVKDPAGPLLLNTQEYTVVTYSAASTTAQLYLNGNLVGVATIPTNRSPANYGVTFNDWLGRDEFGSDPMFVGAIGELRIWNGAVSPLYIFLSSIGGPDVVVSNLTPVSVAIQVPNTTLTNGTEQASVTANFSQLTNVSVTAFATNWSSSSSNVLTVSTTGLITAVGPGTATISAVVNGVTGTSAPITVPGPPSNGPLLVHRWSFNTDDNDSVGGANGTNMNGAYLDGNGHVVIPGSGYVSTQDSCPYVALPPGIMTNLNSITVECWLTDNAGQTWAEPWCFGGSTSGPSEPAG